MDLLAAYESGSDSGPDDGQEAPADAEQHSEKPCKRLKPSNRAEGPLRVALPSAAALLGDAAGLGAPLGTHAAPPCTSGGTQQQQQQQQQQQPLGAAGQAGPPARVRSFPHVEGNFPTVVYIAVPDALHAQLRDITSMLVAQCPAGTRTTAAAAGAGAAEGPLQLWPTHPAGPADPPQAAQPAARGAIAPPPPPNQQQQQQQRQEQQQQAAPRPQELPLHISVSRTVAIRHIQIDSLRAALAKQLKPFRACRVTLQGLTALVNEGATRSFVGLRVAAGERQVVRLIEAVNRAFIMHGLQTFHETPHPHVSLAWTPGDQAARLQPWLASLDLEPLVTQVSQITVQTGMIKHVVWQG